ncbi:RNA polymerase sigma factor [Deinococcus aquaedulcis]|uniref:RNA polymerase sigma factor n=1 Tax=Deinococcus aquaedulcis TaxID=2840455 RepID=UPI001C830E61|nr:RNA polymerase sigma factor [Deinococcus aquaedulcis]
MEDLPDETLLELILAGSEQAFRELYRRESGYIHGLLQHLLRSPDDIEQAVYETFLAFRDKAIQLQHLHGQIPKRELYRLALQRAWFRRRLTAPVDTALEVYLPFLQAPPTLERLEQRADVERLLEGLSGWNLELVILRWYSGFTYEEIADLQRIPVGTVKSRVAAVVRRLRQRAHELGWEEDESS